MRTRWSFRPRLSRSAVVWQLVGRSAGAAAAGAWRPPPHAAASTSLATVHINLQLMSVNILAFCFIACEICGVRFVLRFICITFLMFRCCCQLKVNLVLDKNLRFLSLTDWTSVTYIFSYFYILWYTAVGPFPIIIELAHSTLVSVSLLIVFISNIGCMYSLKTTNHCQSSAALKMVHSLNLK